MQDRQKKGKCTARQQQQQEHWLAHHFQRNRRDVSVPGCGQFVHSFSLQPHMCFGIR